MGKKVFAKQQWYICVLVIVLLLLSAMSWFNFGLDVLGLLTNNSTENGEGDIKTNGKTGETATQGNHIESGVLKNITNLCDSLDSLINSVDLTWSVYENSSLSKMDSVATYLATGEVSSVQVVGGSEGWLFYRTNKYGTDSIGDYEGTNLYSQQELDNIAQDVISAQNELKKRGIKVEFFIPPNKENVYFEFMPDTYSHADISRSDKLIEYLKEKGVNIVSAKEELIKEHLTTPLYYKTDTHWNQLGAYIGVRKVLSELGIHIPELSDRIFTSKDLNGNYNCTYGAELSRMAGLQFAFKDDEVYEIEGCTRVDWQAYENEQSEKGVSHFHNDNAKVKTSMLLIGDSFRTMMIPPLGEQFEDLYVISREEMSIQKIDEISPEYMIIEYVERYSGRLKDIGILKGLILK